MRKSVSRVWFAVACAVVGANGALAGDEPTAKEKAANEAWLPSIAVFRANRHDERGDIAVPPSAFPDLAPPSFERKEKENFEAFQKRRAEAFDKLCPRLRGITALKIEAADDDSRKLLKARVHQILLEHQYETRPLGIVLVGPDPYIPGRDSDRLLEIRGALTELWAGHPKDLAPWLEELLVAAKELERYTRLWVEAGGREPQALNASTRARLQIELALWKAKNPGAKPIKDPPAKKDAPAPKSVDGDWLSGTKVPPTLFPDLVPPALEFSDSDNGWRMFSGLKWLMRGASLCPRLFGSIPLKIEPTDDVARKLLKARLHQGTIQYRLTQLPKVYVGPDPFYFIFDANCLLDMQAAAVELWASQPKELAPWLEELLVAAKEQERWTQLRTEAGALKPSRLNYATQVRLKVEAELWKAKNAK